MNLGIFLGIGEGLSQMEESGQKDRFINYYLKNYLKNFNEVYLFTYDKENINLPKNVFLVPNNNKLHRYFYAFLLPFIHRKKIAECDVLRGFGMTSVIPAIFVNKPFVFNYPYDYIKFLKADKKYIFIPFFLLLQKLAYIKSSKIFVSIKRKLKLTNRKLVYLPNGVDVSRFKRLNKKHRGMIYVGRLESQKNLFFLLDVVSNLNKAKITFVGNGSLTTRLKKYALKKKVELNIIPLISNNKLPFILSHYSIFVMTSFEEGSPKALLEAMACGLVPVVTNFETAREIITDKKDGFISDFNENNYLNYINQLSNKRLLSQMSKNAVSTIKNKFNLENILNEEIKLLKNVAV